MSPLCRAAVRGHSPMSRAERAVRWSTTAVVVGVAAVAAIVSYRHALAVIRANGETGPTAYLVPFTVDGLIFAASMVMLTAARAHIPAPTLARWLLGLGIMATLAANVAHGADAGPVGAIVAAWPAVSLVGSYELLMWIVRDGTITRANAAPEDGTAPWTPPAAVAVLPPSPAYRSDPRAAPEWQERALHEFATELDDGTVPSIRAIKRRLGIGSKRASEVQAFLRSRAQP